MLTSEIFSAWQKLSTLSLIEVLDLNGEDFGGNCHPRGIEICKRGVETGSWGVDIGDPYYYSMFSSNLSKFSSSSSLIT